MRRVRRFPLSRWESSLARRRDLGNRYVIHDPRVNGDIQRTFTRDVYQANERKNQAAIYEINIYDVSATVVSPSVCVCVCVCVKQICANHKDLLD